MIPPNKSNFMKKSIALFLFLLTTQFALFPNSKESSTPSIQIKFNSTKIKQHGASSSTSQDIQSCLELLANYAQAQEQRELTFEEMMMVMQILMFLFLQDSDDYSKKIDVVLKNGKKLALPYSSHLFASLCQQTSQQNQQDS